MRTLVPLLLLAAFFAAPGATLSARAQSKIAVVDMRKLLNGYWKTKQGNVLLEARRTELRKEVKDMTDGLEKAEADYKQLLAQANDPAISETERARRQQAATDKDKEINESKTEYDQFTRQAEVQLQDKAQNMTTQLVSDIQATVTAKAKLAGYSLVLNSASDAVVYSSGETDITTEVLAELNAGAPIDVNSTTNSAPATSGTSTGNP